VQARQKYSLPLVAGTDPQIVNPDLTNDSGRKPYNLPLQEMIGYNNMHGVHTYMYVH
jgi:hypothetical protein